MKLFILLFCIVFLLGSSLSVEAQKRRLYTAGNSVKIADSDRAGFEYEQVAISICGQKTYANLRKSCSTNGTLRFDNFLVDGVRVSSRSDYVDVDGNLQLVGVRRLRAGAILSVEDKAYTDVCSRTAGYNGVVYYEYNPCPQINIGTGKTPATRTIGITITHSQRILLDTRNALGYLNVLSSVSEGTRDYVITHDKIAWTSALPSGKLCSNSLPSGWDLSKMVNHTAAYDVAHLSFTVKKADGTVVSSSPSVSVATLPKDEELTFTVSYAYFNGAQTASRKLKIASPPSVPTGIENISYCDNDETITLTDGGDITDYDIPSLGGWNDLSTLANASENNSGRFEVDYSYWYYPPPATATISGHSLYVSFDESKNTSRYITVNYIVSSGGGV